MECARGVRAEMAAAYCCRYGVALLPAACACGSKMQTEFIELEIFFRGIAELAQPLSFLDALFLSLPHSNRFNIV